MTCASGFIKFLLAGVNFTFSLAGLGLIVIGVLYKLDLNDYTKGIPSDYQNIGLAPTLTIALGAIIFLIAFFGCCGAVRESSCLLTTYAVILLVIFLCQIALGVFAFLEIKDEDSLKSKVEGTITEIFNTYQKNNESREFVDLIQAEFKCCGTTGPDYWNGQITPTSCYEERKVYDEGCLKSFYNFLLKSVQIIGITVLALSAIQIVGAIFSLCLSNSIKNRERRFRY